MKIKHKLLPLLIIGSTAAIVTPFVTSCSKAINIEMEWDSGETDKLIAEHDIVAGQLYHIHIDMGKWEGEPPTQEGHFIFIIDVHSNNPIAPTHYKTWLNGQPKDWEWDLTSNPGFATNPGDIEKGTSKIDVEIRYDDPDFEPFTAGFTFQIDGVP
ncbi:MAG: hypothetical protein ACOQNY_02145 [Mycoplasmoidaceae bacterium]